MKLSDKILATVLLALPHVIVVAEIGLQVGLRTAVGVAGVLVAVAGVGVVGTLIWRAKRTS